MKTQERNSESFCLASNNPTVRIESRHQRSRLTF